MPFSRHSGLDPESIDTVSAPVRPALFMDPGLRRDDRTSQPETIAL
jgi:hypothetical protein